MSEINLSCRVCSSVRLKPKPFGYRFHETWLGAVECKDCGIIFIDPQPSPGELKLLYSKDYFDGDFRCGHEGSYFDETTLNRIVDENLLQRIQQHNPNGTFLEIGCAGGAFLDAARKAGYTVQGVEFSDEAAQFARTNFQLDVRSGDVTDARFSAESFDIIFMGDVLEHLPAPATTLREINRIIKDRGLLVIECPTQTNTLFSRIGMFLYSIAKKKATVHLPPYHLFEYRPGSMKALLEQCGFRVIRTSEGIISPGEIALRGSFAQNVGKKIFQYPNYVLTTIFGMLGDRIEMFAIKK